MSLKEDVIAVKEEIGNEERFLTAYVKTEKFVSKYKIALISIASVAALSFAGYIGYGFYEEARVASANEAYAKLIKNSNDKAALETLKDKSAPLYEAYMLQTAHKTNDKKAYESVATSKNRVVADMAAYELALASENIEKLSAYSANKENMYKDLALFVLANKYIEKKDYKKARETLNKISATSELKEYSNYLFHSIVTL